MQIERTVADLLRSQDGVARLDQLTQQGMSRAAVRWLAARWGRVVLPGVLLFGRGGLTPRRRIIAGHLWLGGVSVLAGLSAAAWHGVTAADTEDTVRFLVPAAAYAPRRGFVVAHRTRRPDPCPWDRSPLRICSPARAVADAARASGLEQARAIVVEAVRRRIAGACDLRREVEDGAARGRATLNWAIRQAEAGARSASEPSVPDPGLIRALARSTVLPPPWPNAALRAADGTVLPTPDLWFDEVGLAVQVRPCRGDAQTGDLGATGMSGGVYAECGIFVVGVTPRLVRDHPDMMARRVEKAYLAAARSHRPEVTALQCAS